MFTEQGRGRSFKGPLLGLETPFSHFHTRNGESAVISALESLCANASISHYSLDFIALAFLPCSEPLPLISGRTYPSLSSADDESPITRLSLSACLAHFR